MTDDKYTVSRSLRRALWWLFLVFAIPFISGMIWAALNMIGQGTTHPTYGPSTTPAAPTLTWHTFAPTR